MKLTECLKIQPGITAVIGGGGKTTLLRTLGEELARQHTVLLCTTTKIFPFAGIPWTESLEELDELRKEHSLLCMGTLLPESGKLTAPQVPFLQLMKRFAYVLIEADGSAKRPLKAHASHEPVIPEETNQVICVVGASGFGRPVSEAVHRPELYAEIAGVSVTDPATPETEAAVLLAEKLHHRVYINQVESEADMAHARMLSTQLHCPVVAGSLQKGEYTVCSY